MYAEEPGESYVISKDKDDNDIIIKVLKLYMGP